MVREPLAHAASLLEKHQQYCQQQTEDAFVLDYMNWLGHHEFGLNQKVFDFGNELPQGDKNSIDYWLQVWINYYTQIEQINDKQLLLVDYQAYCTSPNDVINAIAKNVAADHQYNAAGFNNNRQTEFECNKVLLSKASDIYANLCAKHLKSI